MKIEIDESKIEILGRGANRYSIVHPKNMTRCLKLPTNKNQQSELNALEYQAYQQLIDRKVELKHHFVECYGLVETNLGQALEVERLFLDHQQAAVSLHQWLQNPQLQQRYPVAEIVKHIDRFTDYLIANDLAIFDLNSGNFMLCQQENQFLLKYVDVKSLLQSKEAIPLSRWFTGLMHRKIRRRAERLKQRLQDLDKA